MDHTTLSVRTIYFGSDGRCPPFTQSLIREVLEDLADVDGGLLDSKSGINCPFVEPFARHGIPIAGSVPRAGKWFGA